MNLARALGHEVGSPPMSDGTAIVFVVDDDVSVRESLELLIRCEGWQPEIFASAQEFLSRPRVLVPSCLILDVSLPGLNGLDLQKRIATDRIDLPIIFITGHGDIPMSVQAMKAGAIEFLTKPFGDDVLLCHPKRHRTQPGHNWSRGGDTGATGLLRVAHASRKASHGLGSRRPVK